MSIQDLIEVAQVAGPWDALTVYPLLIANDYKGPALAQAIKELKKNGAIA